MTSLVRVNGGFPPRAQLPSLHYRFVYYHAGIVKVDPSCLYLLPKAILRFSGTPLVWDILPPSPLLAQCIGILTPTLSYTSFWLFPVTSDLGLVACCGILGPEPKPFLGKFLGFLSGLKDSCACDHSGQRPLLWLFKAQAAWSSCSQG